jgi:hypothetical protein
MWGDVNVQKPGFLFLEIHIVQDARHPISVQPREA